MYYRDYIEDDLETLLNLKLSDADMMELALNGTVSSRDAIFRSVTTPDSSLLKSICMSDGTVVGVCGLKGVSDDMASVWMLASRRIEEESRSFMKGSFEFIKDCHEHFPQIFNLVWKEHTVAMTWLKKLGFEDHGPIDAKGVSKNLHLMLRRN